MGRRKDPLPSCSLCRSLAEAGVTALKREVCPARADELDRHEVGEGHGHNEQLRRCPECGTWYRYYHHHEFDVLGSWDEDYLWRLPDQARPLDVVLGVTRSSDAERLETHRALLVSPMPAVRGAAAVAGWIAAGTPRALPVPELVRGLVDGAADEGNACYRALLAYLHRGRQQAGEVLAALEGSDVPARDDRFSWILLRDAREMLGR